jgi:autotransporter strand-loop-strand O-heptosyltransferase
MKPKENHSYSDISKLLLQSNTDKNTTHKYGTTYDLVFNTQFIKLNRPLKVLEIGVSAFGEGSSNSIADIHYVEKYVGIDIDEYKGNIRNNVVLYTGKEFDAYTYKMIELLKSNEGKFDIIIDDGPHTWESQIWFLENYYQLLNEGGVLVCEDIHETNYDKLKQATSKLNLYTLDLRLNSNINRDEIITLRYKDLSTSNIYDNIKKNTKNMKHIENQLIINYINGAFVEVKGNKAAEYTIRFINQQTGVIAYESVIRNNMWTRCNIEYFVNWKIEILENGILWHTDIYNATDKRVFIALDSKSLGDTLAWLPYVEEFAKVHKCKMICSTFMNDMFATNYPDIEFVEPGNVVHNIYAMYSIGLYYNGDDSINQLKNPLDPKEQPLQKISSDILGLPYTELRPRIVYHNPNGKKRQVSIAIHSTTQAKYWNNPTGWQDIVDWLNVRGYEVKLVSREGDGYMGNPNPTGITTLPPGPLNKVMDEITESELFIGIGSGLSWLSWALGVKTVLISGFSYDWAEMQDCIRISAPKNKCSGCFNRVRLDPSDWNWCPDHKGTDRQYECSSNITSEMVITELSKILN